MQMTVEQVAGAIAKQAEVPPTIPPTGAQVQALLGLRYEDDANPRPAEVMMATAIVARAAEVIAAVAPSVVDRLGMVEWLGAWESYLRGDGRLDPWRVLELGRQAGEHLAVAR